MKNPKILINFKPYADSELSIYAQSIMTAMTGNPSFPTPTPPLTDVSTAIDAFNDAMNNAATGDRAAVELKNQKRDELEDLLFRLGTYVQLISAGNTAMMLDSGFKISKDPTPIGPLTKPTGLRAIPLGKGEMKLTIDKLYGAYTYQYEYKEASATDWTLSLIHI